jgi:hypothetical protein
MPADDTREPNEHIAILSPARECDILCRKDDLLDEGVAVVFAIRGGEAIPVALCFQAGRFTPAEADAWLQERAFDVLLVAEAEDRITSSAAASPPTSARSETSTGCGAACL